MVVSRVPVVSNNIPVLVDNQAVTDAAKHVVEQEVADLCHIVGTTKHSDHFPVIPYRHSQDHSGLTVHTALKRIT